MGGAVEHGTKAMLLPAATEATEATDAARQVYEATGGDAAAAIKAAEARYATTSAMGVLPLAAPGGILPAVTGWLGPVIRAADRLGSGAASGASVGEVARQVNNLALPNQMQAPFSAEELALGAVTGSALAIGGPRGANAARVQVQRIEAAARGQQAAKLLAQLNRLAEASKVRERDPAQAQAFFQSILAEGRDSVWITPKALAESGIVDQVAALPGVAEQLATAAETGHDIRLPVADLMAHLAGPELEQGILPHVSTEPGGFTARTAEEYYQTGAAAELQAEVARVLGDDAAVAPARASTEKVKAAVLADLEAAGRFTGGAHEVYATLVSQFYAVQAARLGMTPEGLYHDYPLRVTARGGPGEAFGQPIISDAIAAAKAVIRNALAASKADPRHTNRYDLFPVAPEAVPSAETRSEVSAAASAVEIPAMAAVDNAAIWLLDSPSMAAETTALTWVALSAAMSAVDRPSTSWLLSAATWAELSAAISAVDRPEIAALLVNAAIWPVDSALIWAVLMAATSAEVRPWMTVVLSCAIELVGMAAICAVVRLVVITVP